MLKKCLLYFSFSIIFSYCSSKDSLTSIRNSNNDENSNDDNFIDRETNDNNDVETLTREECTEAAFGEYPFELILPDGNGASYSENITFEEFNNNTVLESIEQLQSICINIEHSSARDLEFSMSCPNGQEVVLQPFEGEANQEIHLGEPNDNDSGNEVLPGVGYTYCWTTNASNGTWTQYADENFEFNPNPEEGFPDPWDDNFEDFAPIPPQTLPAGNYNSHEPLSELVGCPLNGEWTLTVRDFWEEDNGKIFSWEFQLDPELLTGCEE